MERPLVRYRDLAALSLLILAAIYFSVPSAGEIGDWWTLSHRPEKAVPFFENEVRRKPTNARAIRRLAEVLESLGDNESAIVLWDRLTLLKKRNPDYWNRRIRALKWDSRALEAIRAQEQMIRVGVKATTRTELLQLANDYEYSQAFTDAERLYDELGEARLYQKPDVEKLLTRYFLRGLPQKAEQLALSAIRRKLAGKELYLTLFYAFNATTDRKKALHYGSLFLGRPLADLSDHDLRAHRRLVTEMIWSSLSLGAPQKLLPLLQRLQEISLLEEPLQWAYCDLLLKAKRGPEAMRLLNALASDGKRNHARERLLADRFLLAGSRERAKEVLEESLSRKLPLREREETTQLLLSLYEAGGEMSAGLQLLEGFLSHAKSSPHLERHVRQQLAQRYLWTSRGDQVLEVLNRIPFAQRSSDAKAMTLIALYEQGTLSDAGFAVVKLKAEERGHIDRALERRLQELETQASSASAGGESSIVALRDTKTQLSLTPRLLRAGEFALPSTSARLKFQKEKWGLHTHIEIAKPSSPKIDILHARLGASYRFGNLEAYAETGYLSAHRYPPLQIAFGLNGAMGIFHYASLSADLTRPMMETQAMILNAISETRLSFYHEQRLTTWAEWLGENILRSTHTASDFNSGQGIETSQRLELGEERSAFRVGPWMHFVHWQGKADSPLPSLFVARQRALGALTGINWGNEAPFAWRGKLRFGIGYDLAATNTNRTLGFLETSTEKRLSDKVTADAQYSITTAGALASVNGATHTLSLRLTAEL